MKRVRKWIKKLSFLCCQKLTLAVRPADCDLGMKIGLKRNTPFVLLILSVTFLVTVEPTPVRAQSSLVQQNNYGAYPTPVTGPCVPCVITVSFPSNVMSGDVVVVGLQYPADAPPSSVTDSLGSSYTQAVATTIINPAPYQPAAAIYDANLASSGPDTVTVQFPTHSLASVYIFEVSGVTTTGATTGSGIGSTYPQVSTSPTYFQSGAFLFGMVGFYQCFGPGLAGAGPGFTLVTENEPTLAVGMSGAEYSTSGVSSPTNFPATQSTSCVELADVWAEVGIALNPLITTTTTTTGTVVSTTFTTASFSTTSSSQHRLAQQQLPCRNRLR